MDELTKILVLDNEPSFIQLARNTLEGSAYQVVTASNRKSGLEKVRRESVNMVIVGALEPRGDAFRLHKELRESPKTSSIPMLVVDVRPEAHSRKGWRRDEGMQIEAEDYVSRPIEPAELVASVGRILERTAQRKPIDSRQVLDRMEEVLQRIEKLEASLMK